MSEGISGLIVGFGLGLLFCYFCFNLDLKNKKVIDIEEYKYLKKWECKDDSYKNGDSNGGV